MAISETKCDVWRAGGAEAVHVHRVHRLSLRLSALSLLLRPGNEEQDVRTDRQPVRVVVGETKQS